MALYPGESDDLPSVGLVLGIAAGIFGLLWLLPQPNREDEEDG
jgi:hypothetical protein